MAFYPWKKLKKTRARRRVPESMLRRIGMEDELLYLAMCWNVNENDAALYNLLHCARLVRWGARHAGADLEDATILEIGTSRLSGLPFVLLLQGAQKVIANNIFEVDGCMSESYAKLIVMLYSGFVDDALQRMDEIVRWEGEGISGRACLRPGHFENRSPVPAEELDLPEASIDANFSLAVMEHVKRPEAVLANVFRMLKPGGWCLHSIDLRDHRDFSDPFRFLREEDEVYEVECPQGENRLRASDWIELFEQVGYEIVGAEFVDQPIPLDARGGSDVAAQIFESERRFEPVDALQTRVPRLQEADRDRLNKRFRRYSLADLSQEAINVVARKPLA